jgi:phytoene dehydrogenase-like protein
VLVLERGASVGGAAVSAAPFAGVDARLSRYAYLVSLFPRSLLSSLGVGVELRARPNSRTLDDCKRLERIVGRVAQRVFPTLTEPLRSRDELRRLIDDQEAWEALFERPLGEALERYVECDHTRGLILTDATIGTFAPAHDPELRQNRCFLYHVIGNGTGRWDVPVGGMGALSGALANVARRAGVEIRTRAEVVAIETDGADAVVTCADGGRYAGSHVLANVAPIATAAGHDAEARGRVRRHVPRQRGV